MARRARLVVPEVPHHVTQRGNRCQPVFFSDGDYVAYRDLIAAACAAHGTLCLAWCLMPNHVHLILVPTAAAGLRATLATLAEAHRRYSRRINVAHGWTGYLWQGRFASYPMADAHLMAAVRYVELDPIRAGLAGRAEDWPWSSAQAHLTAKGDGLTDLDALAGVHRKWRAMLRQGVEAGDLNDAEVAAIGAHQRTGRPRGDKAFVAALEHRTGRVLERRKPGRKPKSQTNWVLCPVIHRRIGYCVPAFLKVTDELGIVSPHF